MTEMGLFAGILGLADEPLVADHGRQRLMAVLLAVTVLIVVLELIRRRKLREEYSVLWVVTAVGLIVLALNPGVLEWLSRLVGAATPNTTLFFGALVFLMLIGLQFSIRLSRLTYRLRKLTRQVALLDEELRRRDAQD